MLARDIMTTDLVTVTKEASLKKVADLMVKNGISGIPVVDNDKLLGIVTENDMLVRAKKLDLPTFLPFIGGLIYLEGPARLDEEVRKVTAIKAEEIMTTKVHTILPTDPIEDIATLMVEQRVNRLPVVEDGKIVGIITRSDVVKAVASEME